MRNTTQGRLGAPQKGEPGLEEELSQSKSSGYRMRDRRSKGRSKSSASQVEGRRLGPGKASPSHGGGVEAVLASLTESDSVHREKARAGIEEDRDRGVRGSVVVVRGFGPKRPHQCEDDPPKRS